MMPASDELVRGLARAWYPVAYASELAQPLRRTVLGVHLTVYRTASGEARAISDRCPHRGASLSMGRVQGADLECAYHAWRWNGETGRCSLIPALGDRGPIPPNARIAAFAVKERHGLIWTTLAEDPFGEVPDFPEIEGEEWGPWYSVPAREVECNICAAIENFRDVAHLAFVHRNTMGELPHEVEDMRPSRSGFEVILEMSTSTEWDTWLYHAVAPSAVILLLRHGAPERRVLLLAVCPVTASRTRWYFVEKVTNGFPTAVEQFLPLEAAILDEDAAILDEITPAGFEGFDEQVHCVADAYTLKYRQAFIDFGLAAARATRTEPPGPAIGR